MSNIEIMGGDGIKFAFEKLGIEAKGTYSTPVDPYNEWEHYEIWEIPKQDLKKLVNAEEWYSDWGWWSYAKGSNLGTPFDFFTVNGQFMIGWPTIDKKENYDNLIDYLHAIDIFEVDDVCAAVIELGRANGMNMSKVFKTYYY